MTLQGHDTIPGFAFQWSHQNRGKSQKHPKNQIFLLISSISLPFPGLECFNGVFSSAVSLQLASKEQEK